MQVSQMPSNFLNNRNLYYPEYYSEEYYDEIKSISSSSQPIAVKRNNALEQLEYEVAAELSYLGMKELEMLSLITGTPTDILVKTPSSRDELFRQNRSNSKTNSPKQLSYSLPTFKSILIEEDDCTMETVLPLSRRSPVFDKYSDHKNYGIDEMKSSDDSDDEYLFDLEL